MDPKLDGVAVYIYWLLVSDYLPIESPWCLFSEGASMASDCLPVVAPSGRKPRREIAHTVLKTR